ncbi:MAG: oligosaccharide flippase family protein, partial [Bacillota bacterium]
MKKQSLLKGSFILATVAFANRLLGFLLRIFIVKIVGDEGLGIFQMVYPIYITLLLISTAGFPLAISKLIPEKDDDIKKEHALRLLKASLFFVFFSASLISIFTHSYAHFISTKLLEESRCYYPLMFLIPALFITSLASLFRSFFQGFQNMIPTAISQLTEQLARFASTIVLLSMVANLNIRFKAAAIALGITIGEFCGFIFLILYFLFWYKSVRKNLNYPSKKTPLKKIYKKIAFFALPITSGRILHSLLRSFEAYLIPAQLRLSGLLKSEATALFGQLSGMVEQIIFLPTVITTALTISLIPNISNKFAKNDLKNIRKNYEDILKIITYMGFPAALFFYIYGPATLIARFAGLLLVWW